MTNQQSHIFSIGDNKLHYLKFGSGNKLLFAFHGFGDTAWQFKVLEHSFGKSYTVISIDLPFHGLSEWHEGEILKPKDLLGFIDHINDAFQVTRFSMAGFSLGGKLVLGLYQLAPHRIDQLWLFAPDGLKKNIWYNLAVNTGPGQWLFRYFLHHPEHFFRFIRILVSIKLIRKEYVQFLSQQLDSIEKRMLVINIWTCMREFATRPKQLKGLVRTHNTPVYLFAGRYDTIIRPSFGRSFTGNLPSAELIILDKGHYLLKDYLNPYIAARL